MTAAEKAKELVDKYKTRVVMWAGDVNTTNHNVKQCALITVEEILSGTGLLTYIEYWQEVKAEIEKL